MRWFLLLGLWLSYFSFGVIAASLAPLVALIEADLGISHAAMGSVMGAWQFVYIGAAIPAGMLLDRLGARLAVTMGVLCVALSAFGRAWAGDYWQLLLAVMLFGIGGPIISSGAPKVVAEIFHGSQRGLAMGIYMTGPTLGGILALTLTHSVLLPAFDHDWRALMNLWGVVAVLAALSWLAISSTAGRHAQFALAPPAREAATSNLQIVRGLLRTPGVGVVLAMGVGAFLFNHGLNSWLPELLRHQGMSAVAAGYWAALPMVVGILGSLTIPRLATPERRFVILAGLCAAAAITSLLLSFAQPSLLIPALIIQGLVRSSLMTVLILTLMELPGITGQRAGTASGLFFSCAEVGGVLGPLGMGLLYDLTAGFSASLYLLVAVSTAMLLGTARLTRLVERAPPGG